MLDELDSIDEYVTFNYNYTTWNHTVKLVSGELTLAPSLLRSHQRLLFLSTTNKIAEVKSEATERCGVATAQNIVATKYPSEFKREVSLSSVPTGGIDKIWVQVGACSKGVYGLFYNDIGDSWIQQTVSGSLRACLGTSPAMMCVLESGVIVSSENGAVEKFTHDFSRRLKLFRNLFNCIIGASAIAATEDRLFVLKRKHILVFSLDDDEKLITSWSCPEFYEEGESRRPVRWTRATMTISKRFVFVALNTNTLLVFVYSFDGDLVSTLNLGHDLSFYTLKGFAAGSLLYVVSASDQCIKIYKHDGSVVGTLPLQEDAQNVESMAVTTNNIGQDVSLYVATVNSIYVFE